MNIVFVTTLYPDNKKQTTTQVPYTLHYFVKSWIEEGHNVQVVKLETLYPINHTEYIHNKKKKTRDVIMDGVKIHVVQPRIGYNYRYSLNGCVKAGKETAIYLKESNIKCDVAIFHVFMPGFYIANQIREYFNVPLIFGVHQTDVNLISKKYLQNKVKKNELLIDAFAYRSSSLKRQFEKFYQRKVDNFIIPSGIPFDLIKNNFSQQQNITSFVTVSNMIKRKNIDVLIKAFSWLIVAYPNINLDIVGSGKEFKRLEKLVFKLKLDENVNLLGHLPREGVFNTLENKNIFILPSIRETFGMVYLEAMAKGCVTIGTVNEGIDGVIIDGENGFLCEPTIEGCYVKMKQVLELNETQRNKILDNAYETALKYTEENCAREYIKNIEAVMKTWEEDKI